MLSLESLIVAALLLIIGIAFCFGGYRWFMILLPVFAFLVGFIVGAAMVFGVYGESILSLIVIVVAGLITGLQTVSVPIITAAPTTPGSFVTWALTRISISES